ncbi:MAG TPA: PEP-CTERM sorting domain-containing protein, partial [Bryobacteraceae bacterium]|nr:PEP-CTERM sorting domain-containing protein [Bryobacteraceae bacterium]
PAFNAPVLSGSMEMQSVTLPFDVTGWIRSWERVDNTGLHGDEVLYLQIAGRGTATINGRFPDPNGPFVMYNFQGDFTGTASTVPEPATMALTAAAAGLAALAQKRVRRRSDAVDC